MFKEIRTRKKMPLVSLAISRNVFRLRIYNQRGYVHVVLDLWDKHKQKEKKMPDLWINPQMNFDGKYKSIFKVKK